MRLLRLPGVETAEETVRASPYVSALLSFAPHLVGNGFIRSACTDFAGTETNVVGAIIDRPILIM